MKRIVVLSDMQIPLHDKKAIKAVVKFVKDISRSDAEKKLWTSVSVWVQERDRLFSEWQNSKVGSSQRKRIRREYENLILALTESNTYFSDFANRYLNGDPMADIREIIQTEEVA